MFASATAIHFQPLFIVMLSVIMLNVVMLNVVMLNIVMLSVIMLNVVAPFKGKVVKIMYFTLVGSKKACQRQIIECSAYLSRTLVAKIRTGRAISKS